MNSTVLILDAVGALGILGTVVAIGLARTKSREEDLNARVRRFAEAGAGLAINFPSPQASAEPNADFSIKGLVKRYRERNIRTPGVAEKSKTAEALARADLKLRTSEWFIIRGGSIAVLALIGLGVYHSLVFAVILGVVGIFAPPLVLRFRERRRSRRFNDQLGDVLVLLSNALKAGYSFPQAMASIAKSASPPVSEEFARANREIQLGVNPDEALSHMVTRINSEDLDLVVTAVQIQRVVGGNLAEILDNIAFTIRERIRIKGEIRTLTAQARASGYIITALPVGLALILQAINPAYLSPMFNFKGPGPYILIGCGCSISFAYYLMRRIANIEV
jgi:tight adherence protein B